MYISKVTLVNYRNFRNASFVFYKGINTIIGENGSGKTNLFRAIRLLLDDEILRFVYKLEQADFNRSIGDWRGHWIIISLEFSEISADESIQALFVHGTAVEDKNKVEKATYNLFFRPKADIRYKLSELAPGDIAGLEKIRQQITIGDYEPYFTGKSSADLCDPNIYKELAGDFEKVVFNLHPDNSKFGVKIPHQLSISKDVSFTFIKALRDVVADFQNHKTNPLLGLMKNKSAEINEEDYKPITDQVKGLNESIERLPDVQEIRTNIKETMRETVGETYSPSSLSIRSSLPDEADKLLQSLKLFIGEPDETHEGGIHELSLGGANLIFLTLKLLEFKYQKSKETFANFLLIEEPEAHIHTHIQKTLFDKLDYSDTQIIYSTHSTFISEACNIRNMNILAKKTNYAESYHPAKNLPKDNINKLQRYLDAIRSNLLFAKGVILIEGDAEAILIPAMVKKVFGVSLDELGISLINIGSTGFENVAQIFHEDRLQRYCSIITDFDQAICNTTLMPADDENTKSYKTKVEASAKSGRERKVKLDEFVKGNKYLKPCYADYTFEIDFANAGNKPEITSTIHEVYTQSFTRKTAEEEIESKDIAEYGKRILTMANHEGKGWYALILAEHITFRTYIPEYILNAIVFSKAVFSDKILSSMLKYRITEYTKENSKAEALKLNALLAGFEIGIVELSDIRDQMLTSLPDDPMLPFLQKL